MTLPLLLIGGVCAAQPDTTQLPNSTHGWHLSPHGPIRVLVLFAEIDWDTDPVAAAVAAGFVCFGRV